MNIEQNEQGSRLYYLDNIKIFLTMLVIVHHVGQGYGPTGGFWHYQSSLGESIATLGRFFAVNAGFFMGSFFLIAGYFIPAAFDRNEGKDFVPKRLLRLGIPLMFVFLITEPLQMYFYFTQYSGNAPMSFFEYFTSVWLGIGGMPEGFVDSLGRFPHLNFGHAWFIKHLLVYAVIYWLVRKIIKRPLLRQESRPFTALHLVAIFAAIAVPSLIVRIWYPIDYWVGLFGFFQVEIAHWPQYLVMFVIGITAYRKNWLNTLKPSIGYTALAIGVIMVVYIYMGALGVTPEIWDTFWAIYESLLAVALIFGLLTLFRERGNKTSPFTKTLARSSYAAYIIHLPIVLAVQWSLDTVVIGGAWGKFIAVGIISIVLSYVASALIIKIKLIGRII